MKNIKVLQLIDSLEAGGAERMAVNIANALSGSVEGSYLCATRQEGLLKASILPEVSYLFLNKKGRIDISAILKLRAYIKKEGIDVIHAHSTSFFMATLMKWLMPRLKIVWHDHYGNSNFIEQRKYSVLKFCSGYFSLILSVNAVLETWAKTHLKCNNVIYLPNFAIQETPLSKITQLHGIPGKRVLCLANLRVQKDHFTLLEAFKLVHADYPDWTLHCVGQDFKDYYSKAVYDLNKKLKLETYVFFYGSCPDTSFIIEQASIGVLSSTSEGLPLSLLEYGLGRLPIVATQVGDCDKVLPPSCHDYLVKAQEPQQLAEQLLLLMGNEEKRQAIGHLIYQHVMENFSETSVKDKLTLYYAQL